MAISFVGSKTFGAVGAVGGTYSVSLTDLKDTSNNNATLAEDDLIIICYVVGSGVDQAYTVPSGFSEDANLYSDNAYDTNLFAWRKFMGATPDTSVDIPNSGDLADGASGTIFAFRGVDTTSPLDVALQTATGTGTGQPDPPAITPTTAGAWVVCLGGASYASVFAFTNPGDLSATTNHFLSVRTNDTSDATTGCGIKTNWTSGAFDPSQWGGGATNASASWAAVTYVLRPSAGGGPPAIPRSFGVII